MINRLINAKISSQKDGVHVSLPLTSQGKFRCKTRRNCLEFGQGFAPKTEIISADAYLEWQIGYDAIVGSEKETNLAQEKFTFIGANNKKKYLYEMSEIIYFMSKEGFISTQDLLDVKTTILKIKSFLQDEYKIEPVADGHLERDGIKFLKSFTRLPTFIFIDKTSQLQIEIMIQKQQYATGVQPMVYLNVPISAFKNGDEIIGKTSKEIPEGKLVFDANFGKLMLSLLIGFGMCSKSHNHDILSIIKVILKNI